MKRSNKNLQNKTIYVADIKERERVEDIFLVTKKEVALSRSGKPYVVLRLRDRTGEIEGRIWEDAEELSQGFSRSDFVSIKGWAVSYQGGIQVNISEIERCPDDKLSLYDFLPSTERDIEGMVSELREIIGDVHDPYLNRLLTLFVEDEEIMALWQLAPAAKSMHHAYLGGLLEHTISITRLAKDVVRHYKGINLDLFLTGCILHDIGKIYELTYQKGFDYSDDGRLLGHITIGVTMVEEKIKEIPDFPASLGTLVKHMILSHHGHLEYGSPTIPKTVEAIMLYYLDDMDSKIQSVQNHIRMEVDSESNWTSYHRLYERHIFKGDPYKGVVDATEMDVRHENGSNKLPSSNKPDTEDELDLFSQRTDS